MDSTVFEVYVLSRDPGSLIFMAQHFEKPELQVLEKHVNIDTDILRDVQNEMHSEPRPSANASK
jgi:hypothetical protein